MNPIRSVKLDWFSGMLDLPQGGRIIDVGCGKGDFLLRLNNFYNILGIGINKSPYCINDCKTNKEVRAPETCIKFLLMDAAEYRLKNNSILRVDGGRVWSHMWLYPCQRSGGLEPL